MKIPYRILVAFLLLTALQPHAQDIDALVAQARSAAPAMISADATIVVDGKVVVEGSNGWTCMPETLPGDNSPICNDAVWMELLTAMGNKAPFSTDRIGFSYMLKGDGGVSNSDPFHANHAEAEDYIKEGPHLMIIVPGALLEGLTRDPHAGGPYVMWGDTPYAHIMVPVADRE